MRLQQNISGLTGWRRNLVAFFCGVLATLTLAPVFAFPLIIPAFTGLYWLVENAPRRRRAFWDGWWWGWGFYISGLYWFCIALMTDAEKFGWLLPFALFGLTAIIAIYCGIAGWISALIRLRGLEKLFVFSVVWMCVEYARGHLFTGFPWNLEGYSFGFSDAAMQLASVIGIYGLTWFSVLLGVSVAALSYKRGRIFIAIVWGTFFISMAWGQWRLHETDHLPESERYVDNVTLRLVQANVAQSDKWDPALQLEGLRKHIRLTQSPGLEKITAVIWPETAVPYIVKPGAELTEILGSILPSKTLLITGALSAEGDVDNLQIWNSLIALDHGGKIIGRYDKSGLVPFGEFLPFRDWLPPSWLTPVGIKDFSRGKGAATLSWDGLPLLSPLICYEVIFPGRVVDSSQRPQWLLNITNDAWFGHSSGPYQHFQMSRFRAVEEGIPLVRVANTGISAVVDPFGRVLNSMSLGTEGILDVKLPKPISQKTPFIAYNYLFILLLILVAGILILKPQQLPKN